MTAEIPLEQLISHSTQYYVQKLPTNNKNVKVFIEAWDHDFVAPLWSEACKTLYWGWMAHTSRMGIESLRVSKLWNYVKNLPPFFNSTKKSKKQVS